MGQSQTRQRRLDQLRKEFGRSNLHQSSSSHDQMGFADGRIYCQYPSGLSQAPLIRDFSFVKISPSGFQRDHHVICRNYQLKMDSDMLVQFVKTPAQSQMTVGRIEVSEVAGKPGGSKAVPFHCDSSPNCQRPHGKGNFQPARLALALESPLADGLGGVRTNVCD
jgi:hypothetical protein